MRRWLRVWGPPLFGVSLATGAVMAAIQRMLAKRRPRTLPEARP